MAVDQPIYRQKAGLEVAMRLYDERTRQASTRS